jgi:hypothetical protein
MPFLKIDTSGMNARFGRAKIKPEKSRQVTEFNTPSKNRAPDIPKTEAKEGDILSYFDDGKGKVLTSFDGGYQSSMTSKVSDMNRIDLGFDPMSIEAGKGSRITFRGVVQAGLVGQNIITITSGNKAQYISGKALYLDGSLGGDVGSFVRANTACEINEIVIDDAGHFDACIVILESGGANWTFEMGTSSAQNNDLVMDSDDLFYAELSSNDMTITSGARAMFTRSSNDWKLHSLSSLDGIIMQTGTLQPIADDTYDLGKDDKRWDDVYATNGTIQTSDSRLKESISDSALGLNFLNELRPVQFKFKDKTRRHYGLVAQEVEQVLSDSGISTTDFAPLIHDGDSDRYGMRYSEFTSILIKAIQELSKEVEELKKE